MARSSTSAIRFLADSIVPRAAIGLVLTPILINLVGLLFAAHPSYGQAQGLGSLFFFLGVFAAPPGALYWGIAGGLIDAKFPPGTPTRRLAWRAAVLAYVALILAVAFRFRPAS